LQRIIRLRLRGVGHRPLTITILPFREVANFYPFWPHQATTVQI